MTLLAFFSHSTTVLHCIYGPGSVEYDIKLATLNSLSLCCVGGIGHQLCNLRLMTSFTTDQYLYFMIAYPISPLKDTQALHHCLSSESERLSIRSGLSAGVLWSAKMA
jgi:hypothetical protein